MKHKYPMDFDSFCKKRSTKKAVKIILAGLLELDIENKKGQLTLF